MAENVKVIVRCRPMNRRETELNCQCVVKMRDCTVETWDPTEGPSLPKHFTFDSVYGQTSNTEGIYNDICYPLVESVLEGYNSTIFVYGQTGCGKSHTMEGNKGNTLYPEKGIISRTFEHIFEAISVTSGVKYLALVSYLEIYNEQIRDLLLPTDKAANNVLSLKEIPNEGVTVPGLSTQPVHNVAECEELLSIGSKNRMIGATLMNESSSRSHSIFIISIEQASSTDSNESIRKGKLNLVDLAGSERQTKTGATGDRLKEATKINLSLSALGNVISALVDGKAKHIPYRDSKLTRLLQDSLGGNTRTLMIACISPASRDYVETLSTLRYANRAKNIHNKPRVNEDPKDAMLKQYQQEIERLKQLLETRQSTPLKIEDLTLPQEEYEINKNIKNERLDAKRDHLIKEYEMEMMKLKSLHENEKNEKQSVLKQIQLIKEEYQENINKLKLNSEGVREKPTASKDEIVKRIEELKAAMIGGEKANDKELSERRKRKKMAAERRLSAIAHVLAKIDMNEDREILQNQYKDISNELDLKTEILRKYRHRVKSLEKEIQDIQGEFETERQDYLETIRKQDKNVKLLAQISEKIAGTLKKECNYKDLESIKEQAIWLDDAQKFRLPELLVQRTKLPPAGQNSRASPEGSFSSSLPTSPQATVQTVGGRVIRNTMYKMERTSKDDIIGSYFKPRRATQLLNQSSRFETGMVFNTWKEGTLGIPEYARSKPTSSSIEGLNVTQRSPKNPNVLTNSWVSGNNDVCFRKPMKLEALPSIDVKRKGRLNALDLL